MQTFAPRVENYADAEKGVRLASLTSMRFFAALAIFFFHISLFNSPLPPFKPVNLFGDQWFAGWFEWTFRQMGYLGVSFFFVLSGFVMTWSAKGKVNVLQFWKRRALKVYPTHIAVWALALVLFASAYTTVPVAIANLLLIHGFSTDPAIYVSVNPPSWSLVNDIFFYALFPFLIAPVRSIRGNRLWVGAIVLVLLMILVQVIDQFVVTDQPKSPITPISAMQFWFGYISPITRLPEFLLGMILARLVQSGLWPRIPLGMAIALLAACYMASKFVPFFYSFNVMMIVPVAIIIASVAAREAAGDVSLCLTTPAMQRLGEISFGFYICQGVTIFYVRTLFPLATFGVVDSMLMMLGMFGLTMLGGWFLYTFVEQPFMTFSRRTGESPETAASVG